MLQLGPPFCGNCGYDLAGAVTASSCPECGKPLVEILERKPLENSTAYKRFRTDATLFGLPLVDMAYGGDPGEKMGKAKGIIALGDHATGFIAIGGIARGGLAIGGIAYGLIAIGGLAFGLGGSNGGLAVGGAAAMGGLAISGYLGMGGLVIAHVGNGGIFWALW